MKDFDISFDITYLRRAQGSKVKCTQGPLLSFTVYYIRPDILIHDMFACVTNALLL